MKRKGKFQKKSKAKSIIALCACSSLFAALSCGAMFILNHSGKETNIASNELAETQQLISSAPTDQSATVDSPSPSSGLLDLFVPFNSSIHGTFVSKTTTKQTGSGNSRTADSSLRWDDGSDSKEVMKKRIDLEDGSSCEITVYLGSQSHKHSVVIVSEYIKDGMPIKTKIIPVFSISAKNQCYVVAENDYLAVIGKTEKTEGWYDGYYYLSYDIGANGSSQSFGWSYADSIVVYDISNDLSEILSVSRELYDNPLVEKSTLQYGKEKWIYASGFGSVSSDNTTLLSTEQEFCDKANSFLYSYFDDAVYITRTSWETRWYRLIVDKNRLPQDTLKIDSSASYGQLIEGETTVSDIDILLNQRDEPHEELPEEAPDVAVVYTQPTEPVSWPTYIPKSVDKSQLQNLNDFQLDGFWHSADDRYVIHLNTMNAFGINRPLHYVDLNGADAVKAGNVVQTSSFGLTLKANEVAGIKMEVVAANGQLISDEITLLRTEDYVSARLAGTWSNQYWSFSFEQDGTYKAKRTSGDSYWGYYFVIDGSRIVLTENAHDCELCDYRIEGNTLWLDDWGELTR